MQRIQRKSHSVIQMLESRRHFSVNLGSTPVDLGDLTLVPTSRTLVRANSSGLPDEFTFSVDATEQISLATGSGANVSLRLQNAGGQIAFNNTKSIKGVIGAGTYKIFATVLAGSKYQLIARINSSTSGAVLFPTSSTNLAGGWKPVSDSAAVAQSTPIAFPAKIASTVTDADIYSFTIPSYGRMTATTQSQDNGLLAIKFFDDTNSITSSTEWIQNTLMARPVPTMLPSKMLRRSVCPSRIIWA